MSLFVPKERIAVFRGGDPSMHRRSLEHGAIVLDVLEASTRYQPLDIVITPNGEWLHAGYIMSPEKLFAHIDGVYNAALGSAGEDGSLARYCERFGVKQQAAPSHAAHMTWQKHLAIDRLRQAGYTTPPRVMVRAESAGDLATLAVRLTETFGNSFVVKPSASTQRTAVKKADSVTALVDAITDVLATHSQCIVEAYIPGQPVTVTSVPGLRGSALYHTPIMTWTEDFFTSEEATETLVPAALPQQTKAELFAMLDYVYHILELRGAVKTDLVVTPDGTFNFLEVNSLSSFAPAATMTQMLESVGIQPDECIDTELRVVR